MFDRVRAWSGWDSLSWVDWAFFVAITEVVVVVAQAFLGLNVAVH